MEHPNIDIYLASPYTHPDSEVRYLRSLFAARAAASLKRAGYSVFSPITHGVPICRCGVDHMWDGWRIEDTAVMGICRCFVTLQVEGWEKSKGLFLEMQLARDRGLLFGTMRPNPPHGIGGKGVFFADWDIDIPESIIPAYKRQPHTNPTAHEEEQAA